MRYADLYKGRTLSWRYFTEVWFYTVCYYEYCNVYYILTFYNIFQTSVIIIWLRIAISTVYFTRYVTFQTTTLTSYLPALLLFAAYHIHKNIFFKFLIMFNSSVQTPGKTLRQQPVCHRRSLFW